MAEDRKPCADREVPKVPDSAVHHLLKLDLLGNEVPRDPVPVGRRSIQLDSNVI